MTEMELKTQLAAAIATNTVRWERILNPQEFNPPCAYRATVGVLGKRCALNLYQGVLRMYDDLGLIYTTTGDWSDFEDAVEEQTTARDPEVFFESLVAAIQEATAQGEDAVTGEAPAGGDEQ